jgi:hypothetical protein
MRDTMRMVWGIAAVLGCGMAARPDMPSFGMVGMAPGSQFLRLNVTNLRVPGFSFVGPPGMPLTGPCTVELSFSDGQGNVYKRATAHLALEQSTHLDLMAADLPRSPGRVDVLPSLARDSTCTLVASVEAIHTGNGQTDAYVIRKDNSGNGLIPIYGLVGMAPGSQFLRFNVSNQAIPGISTGACEVELSFTEGGISTLKRMETSLALGTSAHLDLMAADLATDLARAERVEALPSLAYAGRCALNSSVEVITIATGQMSAYAAQAILTFR